MENAGIDIRFTVL